VGRIFVVAAVAATAVRQRPGDFKTVAVAVPLVSGDGEVGRQIHLDGNSSHGLLLRACVRARIRGCHTSAPLRQPTAAQPNGKPQKPRTAHLITEDPIVKDAGRQSPRTGSTPCLTPVAASSAHGGCKRDKCWRSPLSNLAYPPP